MKIEEIVEACKKLLQKAQDNGGETDNNLELMPELERLYTLGYEFDVEPLTSSIEATVSVSVGADLGRTPGVQQLGAMVVLPAAALEHTVAIAVHLTIGVLIEMGYIKQPEKEQQ